MRVENGQFGAETNIPGKENWTSPKDKIYPDAPLSTNSIENQRLLAEKKNEAMIKKFGNVVMALELRSQKIANALKDVLVAAEGSENSLPVLEGLDNEYFAIESLVINPVDMDNEDAITDLLKKYSSLTDQKERIKISKQIEDLR